MRARWFVALLVIGGAGCEGSLAADAGESSVVIDGPTGTGDRSVPTPGLATGDLDGEALYVRNCAGCHGVEAVGTPTFDGSIAGYAGIHDVVVNGVGGMPLPDGEIALIQDYLLPDWSSLTGEEIFATECARCHGENAEGADGGPQLVFHNNELFDYAARRGGLADRFTNRMPAYGVERITDAQMAALIGFVDAHPNATTGEGLFHQFCANCHGDSTIPGRVEEIDEGGVGTAVREGKGDGVRDREYMSRWSVSELSEAEIALIEAYLDANL